ncbi:transcription-repair coupling factor (superfamily II helicase) [Mesorhizobium australicum WSM2073]|uniref:Transcription-repair-coupling factor n=1 Tax=Mesorhizobium australicum (strain HAMBI 3006 / LMG 24608 / WSM2073) TaxID=754035 RepID=L0KLW5_MESAW|nr:MULTISPECIES: DEAD/DEAH box helicase [Mesorhizobium]AGB44979.1 transcription-repair coupling factor (superfamily II helicase) [Mesorhizobium australicum WSM2073]MBZ9907971.1 DEAD/DEAH box helicase [Mesorhizobium sp. BR115XR7A]MBZ9933346.1 DEAD/DEAH box helicase [Mesorhizobium sp. BR1-1-5]
MNRPISRTEIIEEMDHPSNDRDLARDQGASPSAAIAAALADSLESGPNKHIVHIAASERSAEETAAALRQFLPSADVIFLPSWDCLPYDRVWPTRANMGRRLRALREIASEPKRPRIVVLSIETTLQRVPPAPVIAGGFTILELGQEFDPDGFRTRAEAIGYGVDERVDEPGEIAFRGDLMDIFPAGADHPVRVVIGTDSCIRELKTYDPISQLSEQSRESVTVGPASELIFATGDHPELAAMRATSMEERLVALYGSMPSVFDVASGACVSIAEALEGAPLDRFLGLIEDARGARQEVAAPAKPLPEQFYLSRQEWDVAVRKRHGTSLAVSAARVPKFFQQARSGHRFAEFAERQTRSGVTVAFAGEASELQRADRLLDRKLGRRMGEVADWPRIRSAPRGSLLKAEIVLDEGFVDEQSGIAVVAAADLFGHALKANGSAATSMLEPELRIGDVVVHEDHGLATLVAVEQVELAGQQQDVVRLEYQDGASLLVPVDEFGRIWRYGSEPAAVPLDRLNSDGWLNRRKAALRDIDRLAKRLRDLANARSSQPAAIIKPSRADLARFAARFPYTETPDQAAAIRDVLGDLSSGRTMNRLVCGDVGFGKTEVALRACAAAALCGKQVAVIAPTTVLARQHYETFSRRFAGTGLDVAHLSRMVGAAEARAVKERLRSGQVAVVVGTQALAAKSVSFANLGLLVIDEEHRFGVKLKQALRNMAPCLHTLSMSATPIPRTLQSAMSGVQEASVLNSPPAKRRPVRTILAPFDPASARAALLREFRRGGQSFLVVPRIEDIDPVRLQLNRLVPELAVKTAHGEMKGRQLDDIMVGFANGDGDVLLSTDIIESGLDVPRANTILIWRADRFGLAQLHQLRGRVGRGAVQAIALLLTEPGIELAEGTRARLSTMIALDRLGSGLAISQRDLDLRGAGDLFGEDQAGHMKLIGAGLYQHFLQRAVSLAAGGADTDKQLADINGAGKGAFPESYVNEPTVRVSLYARLSRLAAETDLDAFGEELEDRFGDMPGEVADLLELTRLRIAAADLGISKVDVGPEGIAITFRKKPVASKWRFKNAQGFEFRNGRLIFRPPIQSRGSGIDAVRSVLGALRAARPARRRP